MATLTFRVDDQLGRKLQRLAKETKRPKTYFIKTALQSLSLSALLNLLMHISRFDAWLRVLHSSWYMSVKGPRPLVYFAPLPFSCAAIRLNRSSVMPVYKLLSAHSKI